jgi:glutathione S-transferase
MYTVYTLPGSCSTGIVILLEKLNLTYQTIKRDDVDNYSELVPTNQVPALKTESGQIITEGGAIALYLLEKHHSDMLPESPDEKAEFLRWLFFDYATLHPAYGKMFAISYKTTLDDETKNIALKQLSESVSSLWAILDKELETKKYITGEQVTIVDYLAAVYASWGVIYFPNTPIILGDNVKRFIDDVIALPEFQAGYQKENIEYNKPA